MRDAHAGGESGASHSDGRLQQGHGDADTVKLCVTGTYIGVDVVYLVYEGGGITNGGGGAVHIPEAYPGPDRRRLDGDPPEHQEGTEILGTARQDAAERRGGQPGVENFIQGGGPGGAAFRLRVMGPVISDGKYGGMGSYMVPMTDHREVGEA